jgi:hypothetical protein
MVAGPSVNRHHWCPKSEGGREQGWIHRICHRKIHAELTEREIATRWASPDTLRAHPAIAAFVRWVATKPPAFMAPTAAPRDRRRRR